MGTLFEVALYHRRHELRRPHHPEVARGEGGLCVVAGPAVMHAGDPSQRLRVVAGQAAQHADDPSPASMAAPAVKSRGGGGVCVCVSVRVRGVSKLLGHLGCSLLWQRVCGCESV